MTGIRITTRFSILSALVLTGLIIVGVLLVTKTLATANTTDWPTFSMIYELEVDGPAVGSTSSEKQKEVRRLDYQSKTQWTDTVIESPDTVTSYGTFSRVGSYTKLDGRDLFEFDSLDNSSYSEIVDEGVRRVPGAALVPQPIEILKSSGVEFIRVTTSAEVCFRDDCKQNAVGLMYVNNGQERIFADDSRGIPLKRGDSLFNVLELRIDDEKR